MKKVDILLVGAGNGPRSGQCEIFTKQKAESGEVEIGQPGDFPNTSFAGCVARGAKPCSNEGFHDVGKGFAVIRYKGKPRAEGGSIVEAFGYTLHIFTSSGRLKFT